MFPNVAASVVGGSQTEENVANQSGKQRISVEKYTVFPNLVFIGKLSHSGPFPSESPCTMGIEHSEQPIGVYIGEATA